MPACLRGSGRIASSDCLCCITRPTDRPASTDTYPLELAHWPRTRPGRGAFGSRGDSFAQPTAFPSATRPNGARTSCRWANGPHIDRTCCVSPRGLAGPTAAFICHRCGVIISYQAACSCPPRGPPSHVGFPGPGRLRSGDRFCSHPGRACRMMPPYSKAGRLGNTSFCPRELLPTTNSEVLGCTAQVPAWPCRADVTPSSLSYVPESMCGKIADVIPITLPPAIALGGSGRRKQGYFFHVIVSRSAFFFLNITRVPRNARRWPGPPKPLFT